MLKKLLGYYVYGRRRGKFKRLNVEPLEKGQARWFGREWAVKTLGATFKIAPAWKEAREANMPRLEDVGKGFREYIYRSGKRIETPDVFIQKRGYRLGTREEVGEIKFAKQWTEMIYGKKRRRRK
jgi:hypothetical protein